MQRAPSWLLVGFLAALACPAARPQAPAATPPAAASPVDPETNITAAEIQAHIDVLASDLFEGRETASRGERRAAGYIVTQLEECERLLPGGGDDTWFQSFPVRAHREHHAPTDESYEPPTDPPPDARNIIARLPGSDPVLEDEYIVVGAHYDHVGFGDNGNALDGKGEVHNGADDNASGSATLLDLATSLANAGWKPRRTILFQWYSGEELGLLGSEWYVSHPLYPLEQTVFMINMDMVGRLVGHTLVVGGTGTSPGLSELAAGLCAPLHLVMVDDPPGTAPSDNSSFYGEDIPSMFLFTGLHPDYHRATDDSFRINAAGAADVGRLAEGLLRAIDARDQRPEFRKAPGTALMFTPRPYIGATFKPAPRGGPAGAELSILLPGSPAEHAGLQSGDVIGALDGRPVPDIAALEDSLRQVNDDLPPISFSVWRPLPPSAPRQASPDVQLSTTGWQELEIRVQPIIR